MSRLIKAQISGSFGKSMSDGKTNSFRCMINPSIQIKIIEMFHKVNGGKRNLFLLFIEKLSNVS